MADGNVSESFMYATRQNRHMLPKQTVNGGAREIRFDLPKARLLAGIMIDFTAKVKIKHATETDVPVDDFTPYKLIQRLSLDCNNGYAPYTIGGVELAIYNALRLRPETVFPQSSDKFGYCYMDTLTASTSGAENEIRFTVEIQNTLNSRDPIGLILLQSPESNVVLTVNVANPNELVNYADGYDVEITEFTAQPMLETFSIPADKKLMPSLNKLKIVNSRMEKFHGAGYNIIKLPTQTIYRKLAFYITDNDGNPVDDSFLNGNIELIFNQTDSNYSVDASALRHLNQLSYGFAMPKGVYVFDFSDNGMPNYGTPRDYINTNLLTEFWLKFPSTDGGTCRIIMEQISVAQG